MNEIIGENIIRFCFRLQHTASEKGTVIWHTGIAWMECSNTITG